MAVTIPSIVSVWVLVLISASPARPEIIEGFAREAVTLKCNDNWPTTWMANHTYLVWQADDSRYTERTNPWNDVASVGENGDLTITSLDVARDNHITFTCSGSGFPPLDWKVRVLARIRSVYIKPTWRGSIDAKEGRTELLTCGVTGNPSRPITYQWTDGRGAVIGEGSQHNLTADRSMKSVTCTATNCYMNGTVLSREAMTASINVLYPMDAKVTYDENDGELTCSPYIGRPGRYDINPRERRLGAPHNGQPEHFQFGLWEHRLGEVLIRKLAGSSTGWTSSYRLNENITYEDTGYYVCRVTDGVKTRQTGKTYVAPPTAAVFQSRPKHLTLVAGRSGNISAYFYAHSSSGNVRVEWEKSGEKETLGQHTEKGSPVTLVFHGQMVDIPGTVTVLTLPSVTHADEGIYIVMVASDVRGVEVTSRIGFYVTVTDAPLFTSYMTWAVIGGAATAVVLILFSVAAVLIWRHTRKPEKSTKLSPGPAREGGSNTTEGGVYQVTSLLPEYLNTGSNQSFMGLQVTSHGDRPALNGATRPTPCHFPEGAGYVNSGLPGYQNMEINAMVNTAKHKNRERHYENSGALPSQ